MIQNINGPFSYCNVNATTTTTTTTTTTYTGSVAYTRLATTITTTYTAIVSFTVLKYKSILYLQMFTAKPGQFYYRDVSCFCRFPDECDCYHPKHHTCIPEKAKPRSSPASTDVVTSEAIDDDRNQPETFHIQSIILS